MKRIIAKTLYPLAFWFVRWCATNDHEPKLPKGGAYSYRLVGIDKDGKEVGGDGPLIITR